MITSTLLLLVQNGIIFGVASAPACIAPQSACMLACAVLGVSPTP